MIFKINKINSKCKQRKMMTANKIPKVLKNNNLINKIYKLLINNYNTTKNVHKKNKYKVLIKNTINNNNNNNRRKKQIIIISLKSKLKICK